MGRRGVYGNVGVSGTGLSVREKLNKGQKSNTTKMKGSQGGHGNLQISVDDDGRVILLHPSGEPLSTRETSAVRRQAGGAIRAFMEEVCERRNEMLRSITTFHHHIPKPTKDPEYTPSLFRIPDQRPACLPNSGRLFPLLFAESLMVCTMSGSVSKLHMINVNKNARLSKRP